MPEGWFSLIRIFPYNGIRENPYYGISCTVSRAITNRSFANFSASSQCKLGQMASKLTQKPEILLRGVFKNFPNISDGP